jgi:hypothetical protein
MNCRDCRVRSSRLLVLSLFGCRLICCSLLCADEFDPFGVNALLHATTTIPSQHMLL